MLVGQQFPAAALQRLHLSLIRLAFRTPVAGFPVSRILLEQTENLQMERLALGDLFIAIHSTFAQAHCLPSLPRSHHSIARRRKVTHASRLLAKVPAVPRTMGSGYRTSQDHDDHVEEGQLRTLWPYVFGMSGCSLASKSQHCGTRST